MSEKHKCSYETDRQIRRTEPQLLKIPDFSLIKDGKKIAVEVELTAKSKKRMCDNIDKYLEMLARNIYVQVFYFCEQHIADIITHISAEKGTHLIRTYPL